jgi:hypothetical protein
MACVELADDQRPGRLCPSINRDLNAVRDRDVG